MSPQIVWTTRPDGYIDYDKERWYELTGFPAGSSGYESWKPLLHPDDLQAWFDRWYDALASKTLFSMEITWRILTTCRGRHVETRVECDPLSFDPDRAIPCGLILNELVANAFKYASERDEIIGQA